MKKSEKPPFLISMVEQAKILKVVVFEPRGYTNLLVHLSIIPSCRVIFCYDSKKYNPVDLI